MTRFTSGDVLAALEELAAAHPDRGGEPRYLGTDPHPASCLAARALSLLFPCQTETS
ncbi:hypothetical protein [Streptosporangium sp. NPDC002607]